MSTSNGKDTAQDATDGLSNAPASEHPTDDTDDGEQKTMSMTKDRTQNDLDLECCICLENLPKDPTEFARFTCCGNGLHKHCSADLGSMVLMRKVNGNCPLCRAPTPTSFEEVVKQLRPWVKKKKAWAQANLATKYEDGIGVKQSYEMARMLYELAAQQGDTFSMFNLGIKYEHGQGVEQSYERAAEYYEQAAHLGHAKAQYNLGILCRDGQGVTQSYARAKEYFESAVKQGESQAMSCLACLYVNGEGVERDLTKVRELWTNAAEQGNEDAIHNLKRLDDNERQMAALDPNAIVCSACGLPQTPTRSFNKFKCPCKSTRYCNTKCQKKHWKEHRTECKRLIAELKRTRKLEATEENNKNVTDVNTEKEEVNQDDVEGEEKSGTAKEPKKKNK
jgi:TPR repeat protein